MSEQTFNNKTVVITGGSKGIGFFDAKLFLQRGATVAFCSHSKKNLRGALAALKKYGDVMGALVDVRNYLEVKKFISAVIKKYGTIDILVNNAGIIWTNQFVKQSLSSIDDLIDTNLKGIAYVTHAVLPHMIKRKSGVIINMSSVAGEYGYADMAVYSATKFGIRGFTEALSDELEDFGINVYSICPGAVNTDLHFEATGERGGKKPEEVAKTIVRIATELPKSRGCIAP